MRGPGVIGALPVLLYSLLNTYIQILHVQIRYCKMACSMRAYIKNKQVTFLYFDGWSH